MTAVLLTTALLSAVLDQTAKLLVVHRLAEGRVLLLGGAVGLRRISNSRSSLLGLSKRQAVLVWLSAAACVFIALAISRALPATGAVALGLALGGAASNLYDRLVRGAVLDFIVIGWWPAFNLADVALVTGALTAVWRIL